MRYPQITSSLAAWLVIASSAFAQSGDWQAIKEIPAGTQISVTARHRFIHTICIFQEATDDELVCEVHIHRAYPFTPSSISYARASVRQVRLEHSDASNIASGVAIGGGIGAALGATAGNGARNRVGGAVLLGSIGGVIGGFFGRDFPLFHGSIIYRVPDQKRQTLALR